MAQQTFHRSGWRATGAEEAQWQNVPNGTGAGPG
jgi:hypothetical protein